MKEELSIKPGDPKAVENLFNEIAPKYDFLNDFLSLGLHRVWRRKLMNLLSPVAGENWVDLCCGTGDMALTLARKVTPGGTVLGIDSAIQPLAFARKKSSENSLLQLSWLQRDALDTKLPSNYFDGAIMAYGLRNLSDPTLGLQEIHRILKPEARAGILDFNSFGDYSFAALFQKIYLRQIVVPIANYVGLRQQYAYLEESLKNFPNGDKQVALAKKVGFREANFLPIAFGQMGILHVKT